MAGLGEQGMAQSNSFSFDLCMICQTKVKMSYFVPGLFAYNLVQLVSRGSSFIPLWWSVLEAFGNFVILYATVLCHEFGHGNMARYLGGSIHHILLWPFGGICFSQHPDGNRDRQKILRHDFLIVGAGPTTHFFQAPAWGIILGLLVYIWPLPADSITAWTAFTKALNPFGGLYDVVFYFLMLKNYIAALVWSCVSSAIQLNVALFLFNVFFPMYPADGAKLLVTTLMFCCNVSARSAALVLICFSVPCGLLCIGYALYAVIAGVAANQGSAAMMNGIFGFMGVMCLYECHRIWNLRKENRLNSHEVFRAARSGSRRANGFGSNARTVNNSEYDDEPDEVIVAPGTSRVSSGCNPVKCFCPCFFSQRRIDTGSSIETSRSFLTDGQPLGGPAAAEQRQNREGFLARYDQQVAASLPANNSPKKSKLGAESMGGQRSDATPEERQTQDRSKSVRDMESP